MTAEAISVDELAEQSGASMRTIRFYQAEGLLPPPTRRGRQALYGVEHVDRLRLITSLQERGLRLAAIASMLAQAGDDGDATEWLGLGESLVRPWSDDSPRLLTESELDTKVEGLASGAAKALINTGLIERRADTVPVVYLVPSPGLLDVALALAHLGVDLQVAARLRQLLEERIRGMAIDLVAQFTEEVSLDHLANEGPGGLAVLLGQLQPLTRRSVDLIFAHEMERAQRGLLEAVAETETEGQSA